MYPQLELLQGVKPKRVPEFKTRFNNDRFGDYLCIS